MKLTCLDKTYEVESFPEGEKILYRVSCLNVTITSTSVEDLFQQLCVLLGGKQVVWWNGTLEHIPEICMELPDKSLYSHGGRGERVRRPFRTEGFTSPVENLDFLVELVSRSCDAKSEVDRQLTRSTTAIFQAYEDRVYTPDLP